MPRALRIRRRLTLLGSVVALGALMATPAFAIVIPTPEVATLVTADPSDITPHARSGEVRAFAEIGDMVYVGGTFTEVRQTSTSPWITRNYLFAYNRETGEISDTFLPQLNGAVNALQVSPTGKLIVGGAFNTVNGVTRRNLVALDPETGATVPDWVGRSDGGNIRTMALHGNHLYVGGAFHWINGTPHSLLARLNATTGEVDQTFQIDASVARTSTELVWTIAISPDGKTLMAGGNFTQVNGYPRNQIVMIDTTGTPSVVEDWNTRRFEPPCSSSAFPFYVQDIDFSDDGSYFIVGTNGGGGVSTVTYCDTITRWETNARGQDLSATWVNITGNDTVTSVEATDGVVYTGGHFRWVNNLGNDRAGTGAVDRLGIAALDSSNGMPLNWNPRRSGGSSLPPGSTEWGSTVPVLWRGEEGLYFGQNSDGMGGEYHGRLGLFPIAGGRTVTPPTQPGTPGYLYLGNGTTTLTKIPFADLTLGTPTTSEQPELVNVRAAWIVGRQLHWTQIAPGTQMGGLLQFSTFYNGTAGAPWNIGYNNRWFDADALQGGFYLNGRLYYVRSGGSGLYYRYFSPDSYTVGAVEFTLPTQGINWSTVRGMTYVNGTLLYGSVDGALRAVPFDPTASEGIAVDGASAIVVATATPGLTWSNPTLFYADR